MEDLSNTRRFPKGFRSDESETMTTGRKDNKERVELMQKEVAGLRDRLQRTSQEAKAKLQ